MRLILTNNKQVVSKISFKKYLHLIIGLALIMLVGSELSGQKAGRNFDPKNKNPDNTIKILVTTDVLAE